MHIYMSQRALQEATEAIQNELLAFSYTMLKKGYDVEGIMEFLSVCDDEDIDFILEDADILTEDVVDEMSDEDVNYYGEQLEVIAENFKAEALKRMSLPALRRLAASNKQVAKLIRKLGLLDDGAKQTIKVKPQTRPSTVRPDGSKPGTPRRPTKPTSGSGSGTTKPTKPTKPTQGGGLKQKIGTGLAVTGAGAGLIGGLLSGNNGENGGSNGDNGEKPAEPEKPKGPVFPGPDGKPVQFPPLTPPPPVPKPKPDGKTPWWLGPQGDQTKLGRRVRYDVALQSYRNPSQSLRNGFEMVADYLISEGHVDTVEEARYVINQMEVDDITEILDEVLQ